MIGLETELYDVWNTVWYESGAQGNPDLPFAELMTHYSEPGRHHHAPSHIKDCISSFNTVKYLSKNPIDVALSIFSHDIFNTPGAPDNEERSSEWIMQVMSEAQLPQTMVEKTGRLVMVTKTHQPDSGDIDEQIMADVDLLILGRHPIIYDQYKNNIRKEYSTVPFYRFRPGRIEVLKKLEERLDNGELFHLPYFRHKAEETAKYNLQREIQELKTMKVAVYAGSFDPMTNGHLTVIDRASRVFDNLIVAIGQNPSKKDGRFSVDDRLEMIREVTQPYANIDVTTYPRKVLIDYAKSVQAGFVVRGLRNEGDYTEESAMDEFNIKENPEIVTWFTRTPDDISRISSSFVMGLLPYDDWEERVKSRVPEQVFKRIADKRSVLLGL